mgnify:CR=1 FL=1
MRSHGFAQLPPLNRAGWRRLPAVCMAVGGVLAAGGAAADLKEFAHGWLLGFMFWLSVSLGALFLVMAHHLFDAGWSVSIRRLCEHLASLLFPWLGLLWLPIGLLAAKLYPWMSAAPQADPILRARSPGFNVPMFYVVSALCFAAWWAVSNRLRYWSLRQDQTGEVRCTRRMRFFSCVGIFSYAVTLTLAAVLWLMAMQHQWVSAVYGVYYFAGSVWTTLATVYVIAAVLRRQPALKPVLRDRQFYFLGLLLFAFTMLYAYIHFSQYFIIWNANVPQETFWYVMREQGGWFWVGLVLIIGHFLVPFLALLRREVKHLLPWMIPLCVWAWVMHLVDLGFNIYPPIHPGGPPLRWLWIALGSWAFMGGLLARVFLRQYAASAPYPVRDPRLIEAMAFDHSARGSRSGGEPEQASGLPDGSLQPEGGGQ